MRIHLFNTGMLGLCALVHTNMAMKLWFAAGAGFVLAFALIGAYEAAK